MYKVRYGATLRAHNCDASKHKRRKQSPIRGVLETLPDEVPVDWLNNELIQSVPCASNGAYGFKWEYLCSELLSKLPTDEVPEQVRRKAAIDKMFESEDNCRRINQDGFGNGFGYTAERLNTVLRIAKDKISAILGDLDYSIFEEARFSAGASTSRPRRDGDPYYKYNTVKCPLHVTPAAYKYAAALVKATPLWRELGVRLMIVPGNRITTVPKKTEIDRTIACEPDMNMSLQLAVGRHFRDCLLKTGINLNDQTHNQKMAKQGSIDGSLSTVDLSSASDSISYHLVKELLPHDWYSLLDDLRSPIGELPDGTFCAWEKFSSMGNGFTFELETLLFYALSFATIKLERSLTGSDVPLDRNSLHVYGDDIICPTNYVDSVIAILAEVGFKTNLEKTFTTGPFRESCGKHYYEGFDVTPFYVRKPIDSLRRVIWLLNKLRAWSYDSELQVCDSATWRLWLQVRRKYIPDRLTGGKDINSDSSVASPGLRKKKVISSISRKSLHGIPLLLRSFQGVRTHVDPPWWNHYGTRTCQMEWANILSSNQSKHDGNSISSCVPNRVKFVPNSDPWTPIPMYSEEL